MTRVRRLIAAAFVLLPSILLHGQTVEFGNINVVQNDALNNATSVTLTVAPGSSPNFSIRSGNRGDYDVSFGTANDVTGGVMLSAVAQNGRNNSATGDAFGQFYATSATDHVGAGGAAGTQYWVPIFRAAQGDEVNINAACAWFPYGQYLAGFVRNSAATNGGANNTLTASPGITLGTHFVDNGAGVSTVNLTALGGSATNGVLLVTHAKNEDNYAASRANADGTFTVWVKDNGTNSSAYEQDPVAFVYLPVSGAGSNRLVALGRVNSDATTAVSGGNFILTKGGTGQWYLSIPGHSNTTGVLIISPEGGGTNTLDNIVSYEWDAVNSRWVIESRDLTDTSTLPGLQNGATNGEDMFSFAFFASPNPAPVVAITAPAASEFIAPATFTIEAEASDSNGSVASVEFLRNGVVVGTDNLAPFTFAEAGLTPGGYSYVARATDNEGGVGTSLAKAITVTFDPNNPPANTALDFDGINDYVTMGAAPELNVAVPPTNGFTLECWFRKEGTGATSSSGSGGVSAVPLFGKGRGESDGSNIDCNIFFGITTAGILVADFESQATGLNHPITASNAPIVNDQWYHAAVTFDSTTGTWRMYLDGVEVGTASVSVAGSVPRYDSIQHFGIGTAMNSAGVREGAFAGVIDEPRVWNYARSAAEIAAAKDQEIGNASGLIGRFGLNEAFGPTASSSAGTTVGTLTNGPVWVVGEPFATANTAPTVALTAPLNDASSHMPLPVTFEATASDAGGSIAKVQFRVNGTVVGEDASAPYSYSWTPSAVGDYAITARAVDNLGAGAVSGSATLHITPNPNQAPGVTPTGPADGATIAGSSTNLSVNLADPEGDALTVTFYGRHTTPVTPGPDFSIVAIPDTQYYSEGSASHANTVTVEQLIGTFGAQTQWVLDNKTARNIAFVSHMGDIVEHGNFGGNDIEWQRASAALGRLEHPVNAMRAHGIPFGLAPGNHDIDPIGSYDTGSTAFYNQFFNISRFAGRGYWGGNYGVDNTNNYQLFSASGLDFIAIHLSYDTTPNQDILDWADALLKAHPHRRAIVTSHYIIGEGNPATFGAQGAGIYNALKDNPNLFLLLCGHIHAEGRRQDVFEGRTVYSVLSDYQGLQNGGQGFLRNFTFSPANNRIRVESWSPTLNRAAALSDGLPHFDGTYDLPYNLQAPVSAWVPLATVNVAAGGTSASAPWAGLELGKNFEWYAAATDGISNIGSTVRRFTTAAGTPPVVTLDAPAEGANYATPATINFAATASDPGGSIARVEFYAGGAKVGEDASAPYEFSWIGAAPGTYTLSAVAVDDSNLATLSNAAAVTVVFGNFPPTVSLTAPADNALFATPASFTLIADASDTEAPVAKVEFFSGDTLLGEDTTAPFEFPVTNLTTGAYTFTAKATDSVGQSVTSAPVDVSVFTEAPAPVVTNVSVGTFDLPTWTVLATSPAPRQFNLPGTDVGDLALKINGASVPFGGGLTLASNWDGPATLASGTTSQDNLAQPYANASGNVFVSVLDNTNNNAAGANPGTSEQTAGISVAFLPYADGWTGASVNSSGAVISGNLPAGVTTRKTGTGTYTIAGLSTAGNLLAFTNGDSGTLADNVVSVRVVNGQWVIDTRDNAGGTQDNEFSFVYLPPATTGVLAGAISSSGNVSSANAALISLGATVTVTSDYCEITFGDGALINPTTAALFVVADATSGGINSAAIDNLVSWSATGNSFRVFTQDLPEINGTFQAIGLRFVAIPYAPLAAPSVTLTAPADNSTYIAPATVNLAADASDLDGTIAKVEFYQGATKIGEDLTAPYAFQWTSVPAGNYTLTARTIDNLANVATSAAIGITVLADSDGDGLPDAWEIANGLNPNNGADAALDSDGDGLTNAQEYQADTNPQNAADKPRVERITPQSDGSVTLQIKTALGRRYLVEANNAFPSGPWTPVATDVAGTGGVIELPDPGAINIPNRIYRVTVSLP